MFQSYGHCGRNNSCPFSHDIDVILDNEEKITAKKRNKRRKRQRTEQENNVQAVEDTDNVDDVSTDESDRVNEGETNVPVTEAKQPVFQMGGHRAGYDAFMTGMAFAFFIAKYGSYEDIDEDTPLALLGMQDYANKVTLSGKDIPLQIVKGAFAKTSLAHREKFQRLQSTVEQQSAR